MNRILYCTIALVVSIANAQMAAGATKFLGNITTQGKVRPDFGQYWNQITGENECKWGSVEGTRDVMNWNGCDSIYNYAKKNGMPTKFHTLVWGSQYPGDPKMGGNNWLMNLSQSEQLTEITQWFDAVQARYPDLDIIDVVNEASPGHAPAPFKNALGGDGTTGYDWIVTAFRMARERWPHAFLVYNDYNVIRWNTDDVINLMNKIKPSGYVDALGCQSHGLENLSAVDLKASLDNIHNQVGLPILISEYDLAIADDAQQKDVMAAQFPVFWESSYIAGVTLWGYVAGATWVDNTGLMSSAGVERPALTWLKSYVSSHLNVTSPVNWSARGGSAPVFGNSETFSLKENIALVTTLTATDPNNKSLTYFIKGGSDASLFSLNASTRELSFKAAPDFESPADNGKNNVYDVIVAVTNGTDTSLLNMAITITDVNEVPQSPYNGKAHAIPGLIEAEEYDLGGEGKAYHEEGSAGNQGGATLRNDEVDIEATGDTAGVYNIGYTLQGEWLAYTVNVDVAGVYDLSLRLATSGDGKTMHVEIDGIDVTGAIAVPNTEGWQTWTTVAVDGINLSAGGHTMRIVFDESYINLNWVEFILKNPLSAHASLVSEKTILAHSTSNTDFQIHLSGAFNYWILRLNGTVAEKGTGNNQASVGRSLLPGVYILTVQNHQGFSHTQNILKH